jgi:hypothetical protein
MARGIGGAVGTVAAVEALAPGAGLSLWDFDDRAIHVLDS